MKTKTITLFFALIFASAININAQTTVNTPVENKYAVSINETMFFSGISGTSGLDILNKKIQKINTVLNTPGEIEKQFTPDNSNQKESIIAELNKIKSRLEKETLQYVVSPNKEK